MTGEKGGGLISLSAKKAGGLKAFYTLRTTTFCPNKGDRLILSFEINILEEDCWNASNCTSPNSLYISL
ncbi:MAG: hypothetical protein GX660_16410 [Clostridiaceae bacterium]|nr:hypothetical protein [Clostridiaceae bacterium]